MSLHIFGAGPRRVRRGEEFRGAVPRERAEHVQVSDVVAARKVPHAVVHVHLHAELEERLDDDVGVDGPVGQKGVCDWSRLVRLVRWRRRAGGVGRTRSRRTVGGVRTTDSAAQGSGRVTEQATACGC